MKLKFFSLLLCLICFSDLIYSQRKADAAIPFDENIESIILNPFTGSVIVKEKNAIQSYNPETNSIEWKVLGADLAKQNKTKQVLKTANMIINAGNGDFSQMMDEKKDEIRFISESPFIQLSLGDTDIILNSIDGKVLFNSSTTEYRVMQSEFMPHEKAFLFTVINNKNYSCVYYDLETATEKWITELSSVESFFKSMGSLFSSLKSGEVSGEDKIITTSDFIYASINSELYKMTKNDGKILWKSDFKITDFSLSRNQKSVITMRSAGSILSSKLALNLLDSNTGKKLWKDDISTKYISYLEDMGDKLLIAHSSGFNLYNYSDGKKVWKKDAKGDKIKQVIKIGNDYLYVADKEMNLIDKDGQNKWKKFIEICDKKEDEVYLLGKVDDNRVLYLTDSYANLVDYASGKKIWKKNIDFNKDRPLLFSHDEDKNTYLVYNDKKLYKIDPSVDGKDRPEPFVKLKKIDDDKSMSSIELFDWGISLVGQKDVMGVTFDGETKYHNRYKEPGGNKRGWIKAGHIVGSVGLTGFAMGKAVTSTIPKSMLSGAGSQENIQNAIDTDASIQMAGAAYGVLNTSALNKYTERFNALKHNNEYAFVINKAKEGGAELVKVRKADGDEVDRISIEGARPLYEVDEYNDNLYYVHKNELRVYNKK